jgi:mRNA interferase RelE/StbE
VAWQIRFSKTADKALRKLDRAVAAKILNELEEVSKLNNPRSRGKGLKHNLSGLWRYRVGDYRIICNIEDEVLVVLVVDVSHRRNAYKQKG